ncbi:hypothetical protein QJS66_18630 [Kocuria rhizophila]|nr:hypothetical protein QJS66_18630 [Kocuria rhizophila]
MVSFTGRARRSRRVVQFTFSRSASWNRAGALPSCAGMSGAFRAVRAGLTPVTGRAMIEGIETRAAEHVRFVPARQAERGRAASACRGRAGPVPDAAGTAHPAVLRAGTPTPWRSWTSTTPGSCSWPPVLCRADHRHPRQRGHPELYATLPARAAGRGAGEDVQEMVRSLGFYRSKARSRPGPGRAL